MGADASAGPVVDTRRGGMVRPRCHRIPHALQDLRCRADGEAIRNRQEVVAPDVGELPVHGHQVLVRPLALRIERVGHVVGGRELPRSTPTQKKRLILRVIVAIRRHHVEGDATERLFSRLVAEPEALDRREELARVVRRFLAKIQMCKAAERLQMMARVTIAIEANPGVSWWLKTTTRSSR